MLPITPIHPLAVPSPALDKALLNCLPKQQRREVELKMIENKKRIAKLEAEREAQSTIKLSKILDRDTLFRFAYIPFVVAKLAWDYVDTILFMCASDKRHATKPLCRAVKTLLKEYDKVRAEYTDKGHHSSEEENMYVFEDGVNDIFNLYLANIGIDLRSEYPLLEDNEIMFLKAVYQCHIVLLSIYKYCEIQKAKVEKLVGHRIGDVLPSSLRRLDSLVMAFVGDKPISAKLQEQQATYAINLANRMCRIELNDTDNGDCVFADR